MTKYTVAAADDLAEGERITLQLEGREITVFNLEGVYYAYLNWCMHQSGPVCEGDIGSTIEASYDRESLEVETSVERDGEILFCPWHGFQYDIISGDCLSRDDLSLPSYPVEQKNGDIVVTM